jgi:Cu/Ag efflux pump CusA
VPQLEVRLKPDAAAAFGLTAGQVRRAATTLVRGTKVGEVYEGQKIFDVAVWGVPEVRSDLAALEELLIECPGGAHVPLGEIAELRIVPAANEIKREGASRRIDVTCNVQGRDVGSVAREIEGRVRQLSFDHGYHPEFLGDYAESVASRNRIFAVGCLAALGILLLLHSEFRRPRLVALIMLSLPIALIGGMAGVWAGGGVASLGSLVGFVTVFGVAIRTGIMLISHYQHLEEREGIPFGAELILRGAEERLAPIVKTSLTTAQGLLTHLIAGNRPGHEIEYPMALVIFGGLVSSTTLSLMLLPALYGWIGRPRKETSA